MNAHWPSACINGYEKILHKLISFEVIYKLHGFYMNRIRIVLVLTGNGFASSDFVGKCLLLERGF
jgi:hypothetical protein